MVYEIPDNNGQQFASLSRISSANIADLSMANSGTGRAPGWGMEIHSAGASRAASCVGGIYYIQNESYVAASVTLNLSANNDPSGYDRVDIVEIDEEGNYSVIEGTAGSIAYEPPRSMDVDNLRPSKCKLAAVLVRNGDNVVPEEQFLQRTFEVYPRHKIIPVNGMPGPKVGNSGDWAINTITNELWLKEGFEQWASAPWKAAGDAVTVNRNFSYYVATGNSDSAEWPEETYHPRRILRRIV